MDAATSSAVRGAGVRSTEIYFYRWMDENVLAKIFGEYHLLVAVRQSCNDTDSQTYKYNEIPFKLGYLNLYDLLQMYEVHEAYQKVITENVMKNRCLDISSISQNYDVRHAFKYLGKFTPEIIIKQSDIQYKREDYSYIEEIVRLIGKRCTNGYLKKVTIDLDAKEKGANDFRTEMPNVLLNIDSLTIGGGAGSTKEVKCDKFLDALKNGHKLSSIKLKNMRNPAALLKILNVKELRELSIEFCFVSCTEFWPNFFENGMSTLESLSWIDSYEIGPLEIGSVDLAKAFPALKRLRLGGKDDTLTVSTLPKLTYLELHAQDIFGDGLLPLVTALKNSGNSIEEFSFIRCQGRSNRQASSVEVKTLWSEVMLLSANLRTIKIKHFNANDNTDYIHLIEQIPNVANIQLIGTQNVTHNEVESLVKKSGIRSITIRADFDARFYNKLVSYRQIGFKNSPPIVIYMCCIEHYFNRLKQEIDDYDTKSNYIRLHHQQF